jgi:hypothetical protein
MDPLSLNWNLSIHILELVRLLYLENLFLQTFSMSQRPGNLFHILELALYTLMVPHPQYLTQIISILELEELLYLENLSIQTFNSYQHLRHLDYLQSLAFLPIAFPVSAYYLETGTYLRSLVDLNHSPNQLILD